MELLVVIAIVAILTLIALPNFLEAQTRSKVARVRASLRTAAAAIEAYAVDNRHYIPFGNPEEEWLPLTTPIPYLTSMDAVLDPFTPRDDGDGIVNPWQHFFYHGCFNDPPPAGLTPPDGFAIQWLYWREYYGAWRIDSVGPSHRDVGQEIYTPAMVLLAIPYDPSNGTISEGMIFRSQKRGEE